MRTEQRPEEILATIMPAGPDPAGELKRDPVCGTYVSTASSVKRTIEGQVVHFCSTACSEKYLSGKA